MAWVLGSCPANMDPTLVKRVIKPKAPADVTPITVDFRGTLGAIEDDTLNSNAPLNVVIVRNDDAPNDLVFVPPPVFNEDSTRATLWFAAGTAVCEYLISITAQSAFGQTLERSFILPVYYR